MAELEQRPKIELEVAFKLNEAEVRAEVLGRRIARF
jgi:hypothetical protein